MSKFTLALLLLLPFQDDFAQLSKLARTPVRIEMQRNSKLAEICAAASKVSGVRIEASIDKIVVPGVVGTGTVGELLTYLEIETGLRIQFKAGGFVLDSTGSDATRRTLVALALAENVGFGSSPFAAVLSGKRMTLSLDQDTPVESIAGYFSSVLDLKIKYQDDALGAVELPSIRLYEIPAGALMRVAFLRVGLLAAVKGGDLLIGKPDWVREQLTPGLRDPLAASEPAPDFDLAAAESMAKLARIRMEFNFIETPAQDVMSFFSDFSGVPVVAAESYPAVSIDFKGDLPALEVLGHVLAKLKWTYVTEGGALILGSPEGLRRRFCGSDEPSKEPAREMAVAEIAKSLGEPFLTASAEERSKLKIKVPAGAGPAGRARALLEQAGIRVICVDKGAVLHARLDSKAEAERWKDVTPEGLDAAGRRATSGLADIAKKIEALQPKLNERSRKFDELTAATEKKLEAFAADLDKEVKAEIAKLQAEADALGVDALYDARDKARDAIRTAERKQAEDLGNLGWEWTDKIRKLEREVQSLQEKRAPEKEIEAAKAACEKATKEYEKEKATREEKNKVEMNALHNAADGAEKKASDGMQLKCDFLTRIDRAESQASEKKSRHAERLGQVQDHARARVDVEFEETLALQRNLELDQEACTVEIRRTKARGDAAFRGELPLPALVTISADGRILENVILHSANVGSFTIEKAGWRFRVVEVPGKVKIAAVRDGKSRDVDPVTLKLK